MRRQPVTFSPEEAMQLLVDPMCNFFAGLVFLSVLVAVLAEKQSSSPWPEAEKGRTFANEELLRARLSETREKMELLKKENQKLAGGLETGAVLPSLTAVEKALVQASADLDGSGNLQSPDQRAALEGTLIRERDRLRGQFEILGNEITALREESARLRGRLDRLAPAGGGASDSPEVRVRLPLARAAHQTPLYVMISGGKFFPLQDASGREDETHVVRERTEEVDEIRPREAKGISDVGDMEKFFTGIDTQRHYAVLVVYADSFAQYDALRKILENRQQAFGWEPRPVGAPLRLTAQGFKPEVL
jgi:hypothetical protein